MPRHECFPDESSDEENDGGQRGGTTTLNPKVWKGKERMVIVDDNTTNADMTTMAYLDGKTPLPPSAVSAPPLPNGGFMSDAVYRAFQAQQQQQQQLHQQQQLQQYNAYNQQHLQQSVSSVVSSASSTASSVCGMSGSASSTPASLSWNGSRRSSVTSNSSNVTAPQQQQRTQSLQHLVKPTDTLPGLALLYGVRVRLF